MIAVEATPGALVVDSYAYSTSGTAAHAAALAAEGVAGAIGYLGAMTPARVQYLHDAGLAFMPVTFGVAPAHFSTLHSGAACQALDLPPGVSVFLDLEGLPTWHSDPAWLIDQINAWCTEVKIYGYMPCLYVGVPQPLTAGELYSLPTVRYWMGQGRNVDRFGHSADPDCGFCMHQHYPSLARGGLLVDDNTIAPDALGRLPVWAAPG